MPDMIEKTEIEKEHVAKGFIEHKPDADDPEPSKATVSLPSADEIPDEPSPLAKPYELPKKIVLTGLPDPDPKTA